jgi:hypothetical protein
MESLCSTGRSSVPKWRSESALAVQRKLYSRFVQCFAIPELARDLAMTLIECLAVVRVKTQANLVPATYANLAEPVRIRERLARETD